MTQQLEASLEADGLRQVSGLGLGAGIGPDDGWTHGPVTRVEQDGAHHLAGEHHAGDVGRVGAARRQQGPARLAEGGPPIGRVLLGLAAGTVVGRVVDGVGGQQAPVGVMQRGLVATGAQVMRDDELAHAATVAAAARGAR